MNIFRQLLFIVLIVNLTACKASKSMDSSSIYDTTWELEYLSGPKIAFDGLYPDKKPKITFDKSTKRVSGNNGCNGYSADFYKEDKKLTFGEPGATTMMYCGDGETFFMNTIQKTNSYSIDEDGKLHLRVNGVTMMRFKKANP